MPINYDNEKEARQMLEDIRTLAFKAERYIQKAKRPLPDLVAVMAGLKQTRIGREIYFTLVQERKEALAQRVAQGQKPLAPETTAEPSRRDMLRMKKTELIKYAEGLQVDITGTREDIVDRIEALRHVGN
jgi:hypothetical protein